VYYVSMEIHYTEGDVVEPDCRGIRIVAFLTNDVTPNWGGGVARQVATRKPDIQATFRTDAKEHPETLQLGKAIFLKANSTLYYAALVAQHGLARNSEPKIDYEALGEALRKLGLRARNLQASIHMPKIGTGLAGGRWDMIEQMIREHITLLADVYVYELPRRSSRSTRVSS
jgi:O-acetyl-ADP-ribose deacetylase (regulator of RNase III)